MFDPEVRVITNQWKPIQTYYALYFLLAAIHELHAPNHRQGHENTLRFAAQTIGHYFPSPWRCHYDFDNGHCHEFPWNLTPPVESGWNISDDVDSSTFVVHFYRTTGQEKRYERWLDHGKYRKHPKGHPKAGKAIRIADKTGGTIGFFDVLWRMRKWVNYKEAQALLEGQDYLPHVQEFDETLNAILTSSATTLEHILYALIGDELMGQMYSAYLDATAGKVECPSLQLRRDLIFGLPF